MWEISPFYQCENQVLFLGLKDKSFYQSETSPFISVKTKCFYEFENQVFLRVWKSSLSLSLKVKSFYQCESCLFVTLSYSYNFYFCYHMNKCNRYLIDGKERISYIFFILSDDIWPWRSAWLWLWLTVDIFIFGNID